MSRLVADAHLSRHFLTACLRLQPDLPLTLIADIDDGVYRDAADPLLLQVLREKQMVLVSFDRRSMAKHAGRLTREGLGHAGVILFGRTVDQNDFGKQARLIVAFWRVAYEWDWADRIEYLPHPLVK